MNTMDNWYMTWQLAQGHNAEILDSVQRYKLAKQQVTKRIGWPRRLAFALALLGMR